MEPLTEDVRALLDAAPQLYVAVRTKDGPHVTPELFARSGDRLFCLTAASTLKARLARGGVAVGCVARGDGRAVVAVGDATVIDPTEPSTLEDTAAAAASPAGVVRFVAGNAAELTGAALDLLRGRLGDPIPPHRVVLAIELRDAIVVDDPGGEDTAVAGWLAEDDSPLALPGVWDGTSLAVPTSVLDRLDAVREGAACITVDEWTGYGPSGKQGEMLRGAGTSTEDGPTTHLRVEATRVVRWDGVETSSTDVAAG